MFILSVSIPYRRRDVKTSKGLKIENGFLKVQKQKAAISILNYKEKRIQMYSSLKKKKKKWLLELNQERSSFGNI